MPMDDIELRRATIGLIALVHREAQAGTGMQSALAKESLRILTDGMEASPVRISVLGRTRTDEDVRDMLVEAVNQTKEALQEQYSHAYGAAIIAFLDFLDLLGTAAPELDLDALLAKLALRAAGDPPSGGE